MRKEIGKIKVALLARRYRRKLSIRKKVEGTAERPRICALKSNKNLRVQVIDDQQSKTLFSVQTFGKKAVQEAGNNVEGAKLMGVNIAEALKEKNIEAAVFDRCGYKYTGKLAAMVNAIRENGIRI